MRPIDSVVSKTDESLKTHSGLAPVGQMLKRSNLSKRLNALCARGTVRGRSRPVCTSPQRAQRRGVSLHDVCLRHDPEGRSPDARSTPPGRQDRTHIALRSQAVSRDPPDPNPLQKPGGDNCLGESSVQHTWRADRVGCRGVERRPGMDETADLVVDNWLITKAG